jgi:hypothetical protein
MGKLDAYASGRNDGLTLACRLVEQGGIEALKKEIAFRNAWGINVAMSHKELEKACEKIKERTLDTMMVLSVATLRDEFEYGQKRCQRFMDRMNRKAECLLADMATWEDYTKMIQEELGITITIRDNG